MAKSQKGKSGSVKAPRVPPRKPTQKVPVPDARLVETIQTIVATVRQSRSDTGGFVQPFTIIPTEDVKIPIACGGRYDAFLEVTATGEDTDYPGGRTADQVSDAAVEAAKDAARTEILNRLKGLMERIRCEPGCGLVPTPRKPVVNFDSPVVVASRPLVPWAITYAATVRATVRQSFRCVRLVFF